MSQLYPQYPLSDFPNAIGNMDRMSDLTIENIPLAKQYTEFMNAGNLTGAAELLNNNPKLKTQIFNAEKINQLCDNIFSIEQFYFDDVQQYLVNIVKPKGSYAPNIKYTKYDLVQYVRNGATESYMCLKVDTPIGTAPTDLNYWTGLTIRGEKGVPGVGLSPYGLWNNVESYPVNAMVSYNNSLWSANQENSNSVPNFGSSIWSIVFNAEEIVQNFDCGTFDLLSPVAAHDRQLETHLNMAVDGNAVFATESNELETHKINAMAHQNIILDGNQK